MLRKQDRIHKPRRTNMLIKLLKLALEQAELDADEYYVKATGEDRINPEITIAPSDQFELDKLDEIIVAIQSAIHAVKRK
jgi:hypothetical protein